MIASETHPYFARWIQPPNLVNVVREIIGNQLPEVEFFVAGLAAVNSVGMD